MDSNPFDDPFAVGDVEDDNPFASTTPAFEDSNPFATPAPKTTPAAAPARKKKKRTAASAAPATSTASLTNASATRGGGATGGGGAGGGGASSYAPIGEGGDGGASMFARAGGGVGGGLSGATSSFDAVDRIEALNRREAELEKKQQELAAKSAELDALWAKIQGMRPPNWPRCRPIIHHDIKGEIPNTFRSAVRRMYMLYYLTQAALFMNFMVQIWGLVAKVGDIVGFFLALAYWLFGPFCALGFWYVPIYTGYRLGKSTKFVQFFFAFLLHIIFFIIILIGVGKTGASGIILAVRLSQANYHLGTILCVVNIFITLILIVCSLAMLKTAHDHYRGRGFRVADDARSLVAQGATTALTA